MSATEAKVARIPDCDICKYEEGKVTPASFDGKTKTGQWGFMCTPHFKSHGTGLGMGKGQRLVQA